MSTTRFVIAILVVAFGFSTLGCSGMVRSITKEPGYGQSSDVVDLDAKRGKPLEEELPQFAKRPQTTIPLPPEQPAMKPRADAFGAPAPAPAPKPDNKPIATLQFKCGETKVTAAHLKQLEAIVAKLAINPGKQLKEKPYASEIAPEKVNWVVAGMRGTNVKKALVDELMKQKKFKTRADAWQFVFIETGGEGTQVQPQPPGACFDANQVVELYIVDKTGKIEQPEAAKI